MRNFVVACDIDGTIGDLTHRLHFVQQPKKDYDSFYRLDLVARDSPIEKAKGKLRHLAVANYLYFTTGRPERLRDVTAAWIYLHFNLAIAPERLIMRKEKDFRQPGEVKKLFFQQLADEAQRLRTALVVLDDEPRVLPVASQYGLALKAPECWDAITLD